MAGLQDALLNNFANELTQQAGDKEVWAFIATYDSNGNLNWKAFANGNDGEELVLGSELVTFESVKD
jgi:hypothetical protein